MMYSRRILPNPRNNEELPWVDIDVSDNFFMFDVGQVRSTTTPAEQWMFDNIGWRASSLDRLRYCDYFDWFICLEKFLDYKRSRYRIHFRDSQHAMLFKLKWNPNEFYKHY